MLSKFFLDRPVFAWVIAIIIMTAGLLAIHAMPIAQYPPIAPPSIAVDAYFPGASGETVENTVTQVIEQKMTGLDGMLYLTGTSSSSGQSRIEMTFAPGTDPDIAWSKVQNKLQLAMASLPSVVQRSGVKVSKSTRNYLLVVGLISEDGSMNGDDLRDYAQSNLEKILSRVPGVGEVENFGSQYAMRVWLNPDSLTSYSLTMADVVAALEAYNVEVSAGQLGGAPATGNQRLNAAIIVQHLLQTPEEFANIPIRTNPDGSVVRIKDVGRTELGSERYDVDAYFNGKPSAGMAIRQAAGANALDTADAIKKKMEEMSRYFPPGMKVIYPYDTTPFTKVAIDEVVKTLVEAVILVFLIMYLFMGNMRATIIPTIAVPVVLLGTFGVLSFFGFSINMLTMFAMVLAIGLLVDDAIVVVEAVERIMSEEGLSPREAARKAMDQIFNAIIGITLVLSAVFAPMIFFGGSVGVIYRQFAVTLILAMLFSALMALTLTPALCATLLKHAPGKEMMPSKGFFGWFNRLFARTTAGYQSWVARALKKTGRYLILYAGIIAATGWLFLQLPGSFLPEEDQGYFINMVQLPPGASQERTLEVLGQVEKYYLSQPEVSHVIGVVGFSLFGRGQNAAIAFVRLKDWDERKGPEHSATTLVRKANMALFQIKQAMIFAINPPPIPELASTGGFDFRLQDRGGLGREKLLEARNMALGLAGKDPKLAGVRPEGQEASPQLMLDIDRRKAETLGVSIADLNETLLSTLGVAYINDFVRQGRILRVQMQADADLRSTPEDILRLPVRNRSGGMVPLAELVTPRWIVGSPKLDRYNGLPAMKIAGNPAPGHSTGEAMTTMEQVAEQLPPGFGFSWSGTSFEEKLSGSQAPFLFALSLLVVFLALAALYESWSIPFAVMLVVPLGVFGAALAVTLRGLPNDVYFKVGLIAIIGLSSKNAILIIEFARDLQEKGMGLVEATLEACRLRFRPILMTSFAFILGVLPLAISTGAGANSRHAIGTGVIGGMLAATFLAIFLVPVFFVVVRKFLPGHPRHHQENDHA